MSVCGHAQIPQKSLFCVRYSRKGYHLNRNLNNNNIVRIPGRYESTHIDECQLFGVSVKAMGP